MTDPNKDIKVNFRKRQFRQRLMALISLVIVICLFGREWIGSGLGVSKNLFFIIIISLVLILMVLSAYNWRCPSCFAPFWSDPFMKKSKCKKCGAEL